jgi:hypothetical protein
VSVDYDRYVSGDTLAVLLRRMLVGDDMLPFIPQHMHGVVLASPVGFWAARALLPR